jgi:hypothetical protein
MTKWEYMVVYVTGTMICTRKREQKVQEFLDTAGRQGWELVTAVPVQLQDPATTVPDGTRLSEHALYLKRALPDTARTQDLTPGNPVATDLDDI